MKRAADAEREEQSATTRRNDGRRATGGSAVRSGPVAALHRTAGNRAVQKLHENGGLQTELDVNAPDDRHEREAERVAEDVSGASKPGPAPGIARTVQSTATTGGTATVDGDTERAIPSLEGGGRPLAAPTRSFFETRFGHDFDDVRVHTGARADEAARSIDAEAFTVGRDIVFAGGNYQPATRQGRRLIAHELTHVVQQRTDRRAVQRQTSSANAGTSDRIKVTVGEDVWIERHSRAMVNEAMQYGPPAVIARIYFPTGDAELDPGDRKTLDELDRQLRNNALTFANIANEFSFKIIGYADGRGSEDENFVLALERAVNVERAFRMLSAVRHFRNNFSNFSGIEQETAGEVGPQTGSAGELSEYRRVDVKVEGGVHEVVIPERGVPT